MARTTTISKGTTRLDEKCIIITKTATNAEGGLIWEEDTYILLVDAKLIVDFINNN